MFKPLAIQVYRQLRKRKLQNLFAKAIARMEGGVMYSQTIREIYRRFHGIDAGLYTYGCFFNYAIRPGVTIGRYCSISQGVSILDANHPLQHKSTHPFFYDPVFKQVDKSYVQHLPIEIGHDVWIGTNSIIVPRVQHIGNGAVVAAGAVVTRDVPPYAIVAGNPAKIIRFRFDQSIIDELEEEKWWERDMEDLRPDIAAFTHALAYQDLPRS
jgi:acetyltransferase-like isoleucine patch superfamily enzyme